MPLSRRDIPTRHRRRQARLHERFHRIWGGALLWLCTTERAFACPDCPTTLAVRRSVFDNRFWIHLILITAPLLVMSGIAMLLYRIDRP